VHSNLDYAFLQLHITLTFILIHHWYTYVIAVGNLFSHPDGNSGKWTVWTSEWCTWDM